MGLGDGGGAASPTGGELVGEWSVAAVRKGKSHIWETEGGHGAWCGLTMWRVGTSSNAGGTAAVKA